MAQPNKGYIPASVQRAMDQHMQRMPANLQKYQGGNTYIPAQAAKQMTAYMEKTMPAHMKEYINPYMHQQTTAGLSSLDPVSPRTPRERAPAPDLMRRDHSAFGQQFSVDLDHPKRTGSLSFSPQYSSSSDAAATIAGPPGNGPPADSPNPYDFILKDSPKPKRNLLPKGNSKSQRIILIVIITSVVFLLGIVLFAALNASSSAGTADMVTASQQQEEIARISDLASQKSRQTETKNIAITSVETMRSDQVALVAYLKKNGKKLSNKDLSMGKNSQTDAALTLADQANHFDETFTTTLAKEISTYQTTLKSAHDHASSAAGKKLLEELYIHAASLSERLQKLTSTGSQ